MQFWTLFFIKHLSPRSLINTLKYSQISSYLPRHSRFKLTKTPLPLNHGSAEWSTPLRHSLAMFLTPLSQSWAVLLIAPSLQRGRPPTPSLSDSLPAPPIPRFVASRTGRFRLLISSLGAQGRGWPTCGELFYPFMRRTVVTSNAHLGWPTPY